MTAPVVQIPLEGGRESGADVLEPMRVAPSARVRDDAQVDAAAVRELIARYNDAWNRHDLDAICAMHAPGMVFENHTAGERAESDAVRAHIGGIFAAYPDLRFSTRSLRTADDFAVCEWTAAATRDGALVEWDGVDVFPIRNGLILRKDVYSASHRPREHSG